MTGLYDGEGRHWMLKIQRYYQVVFDEHKDKPYIYCWRRLAERSEAQLMYFVPSKAGRSNHDGNVITDAKAASVGQIDKAGGRQASVFTSDTTPPTDILPETLFHLISQ